MTDSWTTELSRYVDGEMIGLERDELQTHLGTCADCRDTMDDLRQVREWAERYEGTPPHPRVWKGIAAAIHAPPLRVVDGDRPYASRQTSRVPYALAAGIALMVVAGGSFWFARMTVPEVVQVIPMTWEPAVVPVSQSTLLAAERYAGAVAQLEAALLNGEIALDSATVSVLHQKLAVIDRAIEEARQAVSDDPNSGYLVQHFNRMMKQKLALLRHTARVVAES